MNKYPKRVVRAFFAALLAVWTLCADISVFAITQSDIDAKIQQANDIQQRIRSVGVRLSSISDDLSAAMDKKRLLDEQIGLLDEQIINLEEQISDYEALIARTEGELAEAQAQEAVQYERFSRRVRVMEEQGRGSCWMILLRAESLSDLLSRMNLVSEIMAGDRRVIDGLRDVQAQISARQEDLSTQKQGLEQSRSELAASRTELDTQRQAAMDLMAELETSQTEARALREQLEQEEDALRAEADRLAQQKSREEAAAREAARKAAQAAQTLRTYDSGTSYTSGGYAWPVSSRTVTSTFGGRASPGGIGSTNHKGIDIGGVGYNTAVHASKSGKVIVSQYSSSYGNYVVISHSGGSTTLYAHLSRRSVSVGQSVSQGTTIGVTGATGRATGPHLHFEISENGVRVNPLNYLR